jgi:hypothetical protein
MVESQPSAPARVFPDLVSAQVSSARAVCSPCSSSTVKVAASSGSTESSADRGERAGLRDGLGHQPIRGLGVPRGDRLADLLLERGGAPSSARHRAQPLSASAPPMISISSLVIAA